MVRYRKPVERSENLIDLRNLTQEQARALIIARDKARERYEKSFFSKGRWLKGRS